MADDKKRKNLSFWDCDECDFDCTYDNPNFVCCTFLVIEIGGGVDPKIGFTPSSYSPLRHLHPSQPKPMFQ